MRGRSLCILASSKAPTLSSKTRQAVVGFGVSSNLTGAVFFLACEMDENSFRKFGFHGKCPGKCD